jgi:hypothetical protein
MKRRCLNPKATQYAYYGGRGIMVCNRWRDSFETFLADMGQKPSNGHSIDRIDVNGHYEPGNCRWATRLQQVRNTRRSRLNDRQREQIAWLVRSGRYSRAWLAEAYSVHITTVSRVCLAAVSS